MKNKKTWNDKLQSANGLPKVEKIPARMIKNFGEGTIAIPAPVEVDEIMRQVKRKRVTTINEIRAFIARKHSATIACPMTTGIFSIIAAYAAEENLASGKKRITPYWRTLKSNGEVNPKFPGGIQRQIELLKSEGHNIINRGKRFFVEDYEKKLQRF